ncbi:hypothetical protein SEA_YOSIF_49 [Streptomyces phage Yosif]|uniref:Uncharacterized protein n=1 Tax=Streptomyces phage Yosif TaxID=2201421 RepID=A0A2Z4QCA2_9CAUD|nr:hypothetical protein KGG71_gp49 [Streptomyces phage Yosif]AWY07613.1 hypothetical protein SEA_YOSIF_49 [Streptomyces phage Yosif]
MSEAQMELPFEEPIEVPVVEEPAPVEHVPVDPPAGMGANDIEFWDDASLTYYERSSDGLVYSRPYGENELASYEKRRQLEGLAAQAAEAIPYLDQRIDANLAYLANPNPTPEETAAQIKVLADISAYNAGTLKRVMVVLAELTGQEL